MLPYVAYLRVYETLAAFPEPDRSRWAQYASFEEQHPRIEGVDGEHADSLRRLIATPSIVAPVRESGNAYLRRAGGTTFVCPWETRLRSWLAFERFRSGAPAGLMDTFMPPPVADQTEDAFERWKATARSLRSHIHSSTWHVPLAWLVPFGASERWLVLGGRAQSGSGGPTTAVPTRTLIYLTSMAEARRRVARALIAIRRLGHDSGAGFGLAYTSVETVGRWLEEFHPRSLVELDYGGLVHLLDDSALKADESVAEIAAAISGIDGGEVELAVAMYKRVVDRWRVVRALESAN